MFKVRQSFRVFALAGVLLLLSGLIITAKVVYGGQSIKPEYSRHLWRVEIIMNLLGKGERAKVRLTLPGDTDRQTIYNEHLENDELDFYIRERSTTGNRIGFWRSELLEGTRTIRYTFSAQLKRLIYTLPSHLEVPKKPYEFYASLVSVQTLDPSKYIQSKQLKPHLKKIIGREKKVSIVTRKIFDFVSGEVKYRSEKGSRDARATLEKLEADCGGKARLFVALSRAAGIPSRIVGGLILAEGVKKITHVWSENYIGDKWIPFDTVNNHYASVPGDYLELYRGDYFLFKYVGLSKFDYFFVEGKERIPPVDYPWSLYVLPAHFQNFIKVLLLIPVGALVVALFRSVIGIPTLGTFSPILLALAFREISLALGLLCLFIIISIGWIFRRLLDELKILVIPRLAIIVTIVVIAVLAIMIAGFHLGHQQIVYISFFPMIIMTWMVERFSVLQIEDGTPAALKTALGTTVAAVAAYFIYEIHVLKSYLFAFPELLLAILALLLVLGRYTGLRATELWRFRKLKMLSEQRSA